MMDIASFKGALQDVGLFKKCYLLNSLLITFYYFSTWYLSAVTCVALTFWAAYLLYLGLRSHRYHLREKGLWILIAFYCASVITSVIHLPNGWMGNVMDLCTVPLTLFVVYYMGEEDHHKEKQNFESCLKIVMVYSFIMSAITILMFFLNVCIINYPDRYCGVYLNPILSGLVANGGLFCTVYFLWGWKNRPWYIKLFCIAQIIVQVVVMDIGNSRSAYCCFVAFFVIYSIVKIVNLKLLEHPVINRVAKIVLAAIVSLGIVVGSDFLADGINVGAFELNMGIFSLRYPDYDPDKANYEDTPNWFVPHKLERTNEDKSSTIRWNMVLMGMDTFQANPIFGTSPGNLVDAVKDTAERQGQNAKKTLQGIDGGRVHNAYLDVLVSLGLLGAIPMVMFILYSIIKAYQCTFACRRDHPAYDHNTFVVSLIGALTAFFFMESAMLYTMTFAEAFFWVCMGHLAQRSKYQEDKDMPPVDKNGVCQL